MYRRPTKKQEITRRIVTYVLMTLSVLTIVSALVFMLLGYRFDTDNGRIERGALLQFETIPSGAKVKIDGKTINSKTPAKSSVLSGAHTIVMEKDGYEKWTKTVDVVAGTLTWFDYVRLVPKNLTTEAVAGYSSMHGSLASSDGKTMIVQTVASEPTFDIIDLHSDSVKSSTISIPKNLYTNATVIGVAHIFTINAWDSGGRYVLLQHQYDNNQEWLVIDTKDVARTQNVSALIDADINSIVFSGTSGNIFYALTSSGDIVKLDSSTTTIPRALVSGVLSFELFGTGVITYIGTDQTDLTARVVGLYADGDSTPHILRSVPATVSEPLHVATSHYFNQDYIAISQGHEVDILSGIYPPSGSKDSSSMSDFASFTFNSDVDTLSFSPKGDYLIAKSGDDYTSYDIEHQVTTNYKVVGSKSLIKWLDNDHTWSDNDDNLAIREFDGANASSLSGVVMEQGVALTSNNRYIYSIGTKSDGGYQLQRVRMQLP